MTPVRICVLALSPGSPLRGLTVCIELVVIDTHLLLLESTDSFLSGLLRWAWSATIRSGDHLRTCEWNLGGGLHIPTIRRLAPTLRDMLLFIGPSSLHLGSRKWCPRLERLATDDGGRCEIRGWDYEWWSLRLRCLSFILRRRL